MKGLSGVFPITEKYCKTARPSSESAKIVAIDNDPNAPIFSIERYGIVGDPNQIVPMFIKAARERVVNE